VRRIKYHTIFDKIPRNDKEKRNNVLCIAELEKAAELFALYRVGPDHLKHGKLALDHAVYVSRRRLNYKRVKTELKSRNFLKLTLTLFTLPSPDLNDVYK
jgi:hypothetical protein